MSDPDPFAPFPTITVVNHESTPSSTAPVELGKPPLEPATYLVHLFPSLNEHEPPSLVIGPGPLPEHVPADLLAALRTSLPSSSLPTH